MTKHVSHIQNQQRRWRCRPGHRPLEAEGRRPTGRAQDHHESQSGDALRGTPGLPTPGRRRGFTSGFLHPAGTTQTNYRQVSYRNWS